MNGPSPKFWVILKRTMLLLAALSLVAGVVLYLTLTGLQKTFFSLCALIIGANFLFIYSFVRLNDSKRPGSEAFGSHLHTPKDERPNRPSLQK